jgi:hypothetical protein
MKTHPHAKATHEQSEDNFAVEAMLLQKLKTALLEHQAELPFAIHVGIQANTVTGEPELVIQAGKNLPKPVSGQVLVDYILNESKSTPEDWEALERAINK